MTQEELPSFDNRSTSQLHEQSEEEKKQIDSTSINIPEVVDLNNIANHSLAEISFASQGDLLGEIGKNADNPFLGGDINDSLLEKSMKNINLSFNNISMNQGNKGIVELEA